MECFGVFKGFFGHFVLISFRSYSGILTYYASVINTMVLQSLQNYASHLYKLKMYSTITFFFRFTQK
jgi:hypothetical protein